MGLLNKMRNLTGSVPKGLLEEGLLGRGIIVSIQQTGVSTGADFDPSHVCVFTRRGGARRRAALHRHLPAGRQGDDPAAARDAGSNGRGPRRSGRPQPRRLVAPRAAADGDAGQCPAIPRRDRRRGSSTEGEPCKAVIVETPAARDAQPEARRHVRLHADGLRRGPAPVPNPGRQPGSGGGGAAALSRATRCPPSGCPTGTIASSRSIGKPRSHNLPPQPFDVPTTTPTSTQQELIMVLVTGNWRIWLAGMAASLVIFAVVFFTVIQAGPEHRQPGRQERSAADPAGHQAGPAAAVELRRPRELRRSASAEQRPEAHYLPRGSRHRRDAARGVPRQVLELTHIRRREGTLVRGRTGGDEGHRPAAREANHAERAAGACWITRRRGRSRRARSAGHG